jgi:toxin ParE1/3/4
MSAAEYSPKALDDLKSIFDFIAADRPQVAIKAIQRVLDAGDTLAKFPELGLRRDELVQGLRAFVVGNHVVYYSQRSLGVRIERVLHAARDAEAFHE